MDQKLKDKIKNSCLEHLNSKGYPNMTNEQILKEVPSLWVKLGTENLLTELIRRKFTIEHFIKIALEKKQEADIMEKVKGDAEIFAEFIRKNRGY